MLKPINSIIKDSIGNINSRINIVTGIVAFDNGNGSYDVFISESDKPYPNIFTLSRNPNLAVNDKVRILYINGDRNNPIILPPVAPSVTANLISCDYSTGKIYVHSGITIVISEEFIRLKVAGLTYNSPNLISCDWGSNSVHPKIYIHDGIAENILSSFNSPLDWPNGASGLAFDGTNLISCSQNGRRIYVHDGITSTIIDDFASPGTAPCGLTYVGGNLISCDYDTLKIYIHNGISDGILSSFASPDSFPYGLTNDGENLISCDNEKIYKHSGITSTIIESFASPNGFPSGLAFQR